MEKENKLYHNNRLLEKYLTILAKCYIKSDFEELFPLLADNIKWESTWVIESIEGIENVKKFYRDKTKKYKGVRLKAEINHGVIYTDTIFHEEDYDHPVELICKRVLIVVDRTEEPYRQAVMDIDLDEYDKISAITINPSNYYQGGIIRSIYKYGGSINRTAN